MAIISSNGTGGGLWHADATWAGGSIPGSTDYVIIVANDIVTIDGNVTVGDSPASQTTYVLEIYGTLKWMEPPTGDWTLLIQGSTRIRPTGLFQIGSDSTPVPASRTATVHIAPYSTGYRIYMDADTGTTRLARLITRGAVAYHMASASMHRARLVSPVSAGSSVAIEIDRAVDWEIGDVVFFGRGGSQVTPIIDASGQFLATYGHDRTTITGKTDTQNYTVDTLVYDHLDGDILAHGTRNIIIGGDDGYGFTILKDITAPMVFEFSEHGGIDLSWTLLEYASSDDSTYKGGIQIAGWRWNEANLLESGDYKLEGVVFDRKGGGTTAIYVYDVRRMVQMAKDFNNLVIYGFETGLSFGNTFPWSFGHFTVGNVTILGSTTAGIITPYPNIIAESLWLTFEGLATSLTQGLVLSASASGGLQCEELIGHACGYNGVITGDDDEYTNGREVRILSGELYNARSALLSMRSKGRRLTIKDVKFSHSGAYGLQVLNGATDVVLDGCSFDDCNRADNYDGAIDILNGTTGSQLNVLARGCTFGTIVQNSNGNIIVDEQTVVKNGSGRIRLEDCEFKEPDWSYSPTWGPWGRWRGAIVWRNAGTGSWLSTATNSLFTLEIVRPIVRDTGETDQWAITYPGVTHCAVFGGGGELRNEESVILDGSFGIKMTPWAARLPGAGTRNVPYRIPVKSGDTLTVEISLRKDKSQSVEKKRPAAYLAGCGILDDTIMPNTNDTWEAITVTGISNCDGLVDFWVEAGCGFYVGVTEQDPWYTTVYADQLSVTIT